MSCSHRAQVFIYVEQDVTPRFQGCPDFYYLRYVPSERLHANFVERRY